jgi:hypothetical protein
MLHAYICLRSFEFQKLVNTFVDGMQSDVTRHTGPLAPPAITVRHPLPFPSDQKDKLTACSWELLGNPPVAQLLKSVPTSYRSFNTAFTRILHWCIS